MGMPIITTSHGSRYHAVTDIIQSVALEQAALSHILNAEGEKLQCVLSSNCTSTEEILATNESVRTMVDSVAKLEMILQYKLSLFENCLCDHCSPPKKEGNNNYRERISCNCSCED